MTKKKKKVPMLGTLIGMGIWGSLAFLFYPHWSAWIFGGLLTVLTMVLLKGLLSK